MADLVIGMREDGLWLWLPVEPVPASRPRVTRWGVYYGKRYTAFRKEVSEILGRTDLPKGLPLQGSLKVYAIFFVLKPKSSIRKWPNGDLDNYLKTLDSFNGVLWKDDDQIVEFEAVKRFIEGPVKPGLHEPGIQLLIVRR